MYVGLTSSDGTDYTLCYLLFRIIRLPELTIFDNMWYIFTFLISMLKILYIQ